MNIVIVTPAPPGSRKGNRITALRWSRILRSLGHRVRIETEWAGPADLLVALHARKSHPSIRQFRGPIVLALTGTDLYRDIHRDAAAKRSLELADRFVVLQPMGRLELPRRFRSRTRVIYQSLRPPPGKFKPRRDVFDICVLGHLRPVKDPFRAAMASRQLPADSRIRITQVGGALTRSDERRARQEARTNPRYRWLGELPRWMALRVLARSRLLVISSIMEGGANAVSEALACSVPTLSSNISGSIGLLGRGYPGYFPARDTRALASLMRRAETVPKFYASLKSSCRRLRPIVDPAGERNRWAHLLREVTRAGKRKRA